MAKPILMHDDITALAHVLTSFDKLTETPVMEIHIRTADVELPSGITVTVDSSPGGYRVILGADT